MNRTLVTEAFLHYLWQHRLLPTDLKTTGGETVQVIHSGTYQTDAGPDFFNAQVKIGETKWAGNVEVHVKSSDWDRHNHTADPAYSKIILHLVHENDKPVLGRNGQPVPTVELKDIKQLSIYKRYKNLIENKSWVPCEKLIQDVSSITVQNWLERLLVERLERKTGEIEQVLQRTENNWEEAFYIMLARSFGFKTNALPFELLAKSLPSKFLKKHSNNLLQIEAMLFGQAGMLENDMYDEYFNKLKKEYLFFQQKFGLQLIEQHLWKFLRLRPANFPTIRIAQFAQLIHRTNNLFSILETNGLKKMMKLFELQASEYWDNHYNFGKPAPGKLKRLGTASAQIIVINTVVPFLFVYGKKKGEETYIERAIELLEQLPPENNAIIKKWKSLNISVNNAFGSQALLQLKNEYCNAKKCLSCGIGNSILKND